MRALSERALAVELLETGVEATAVIAAVRLTGTTCNGVPVVALSLVVDVPDGPPRVVVRHAVVPLDDHPADGS
nr:hypothetical protein [Micromonospora sp. DSM 115978]